MPLTRGKIIGHDSERLAFTFLMLNGDEPVECRISDAAMDELIGVKGTENSARQALASSCNWCRNSSSAPITRLSSPIVLRPN